MNANELRIGNYVFSKETQEIQKITGVTEEHPFFDSITFDYPNWDEIEPILLTEELLLKFGFCEGYQGYYFKDSLLINVDGDCYLGEEEFFIRSIGYIHEIQNLYFALTGYELTVA